MKIVQVSLLVLIAVLGAAFYGSARAEDDPATYFQDQCLDCHKRKKKPLEEKRLSRAEWLKAIEKMIELDKLDPVPPRPFVEKMADWLAETHGPGAAGQSEPAAPPDAGK